MSAAAQLASPYVRTFNRFEYKYLLRHEQVARFVQALTPYTRPDEHDAEARGYPVYSVYWDAEDLTFFWEKVDGIKFRRKLRFRLYPGHDEAFVEIKQRLDRTIQKRRSRWPLERMRAMFDPEGPGADLSDEERADPVVREALILCAHHRLRPTMAVAYRRRALFGRHEPDLRITVDTRLRYDSNALDLGHPFEVGKEVLDPRLAVLELKFNDRVPLWLVRLVERQGLELMRFSKYCAAVDRKFFDGRHT